MQDVLLNKLKNQYNQYFIMDLTCACSDLNIRLDIHIHISNK